MCIYGMEILLTKWIHKAFIMLKSTTIFTRTLITLIHNIGLRKVFTATSLFYIMLSIYEHLQSLILGTFMLSANKISYSLTLHTFTLNTYKHLESLTFVSCLLI